MSLSSNTAEEVESSHQWVFDETMFTEKSHLFQSTMTNLIENNASQKRCLFLLPIVSDRWYTTDIFIGFQINMQLSNFKYSTTF